MGIENYPVPHKGKFAMSGIQLKITRHTKKQQNRPIMKEKKSIKTDPEVIKMVN